MPDHQNNPDQPNHASQQPGHATPYCGVCGYNLTGLTESSKCPECGRPIVDVLTRAGRWGKRFRTTSTLFGLPILDVALGPGPGERRGKARGIIAIGDTATGVLAVGGVARGLIAIGGFAIGGFTFAGLSIGVLVAIGGLATGVLAAGGGVIGGVTSGGAAIGYVAGGGLSVGYYAIGGAPTGRYTLGPGANDQQAVAVLNRLGWFYGPRRFSAMTMFQPTLVCAALLLIAAALVAITALLAHIRYRRAHTTRP